MKKHIHAAFRDVFDGLRAQPGRVGLSFMAICVGITALTVLVAVLGGLRVRSRQMIDEFGVNVIAVRQGDLPEGATPDAKLRRRHLDVLRENLPGCQVAGVRFYRVPTQGDEQLVDLAAVDPEVLVVKGWQMRAGRFLDQMDSQLRSRCAVISETLASELGLSNGDTISLRKIPFEIVGIVSMATTAFEEDAAGAEVAFGERLVLVPGNTPAYWAERQRVPEGGVDMILIRVPDASVFANSLACARRILTQPGLQSSGISWITPETLLERVRKLQNTIRLTVGSIAILCLVLGGTTLMSLMVANVRDRVTEIGLRRALGAMRRDIALLFVLEGCLVTAAAGICGTIFTHTCLFVFRGVFPVPLKLDAISLLLPALTACVLGIIFSYWPARVASKISPSEALRND